MTTRKDIAERLGVSVSVVSRALNDSGYVQSEKRRQILETAREMGYVREPAALRRVKRSCRQIIFCCRYLRNPFYVELYNGILDAAQESGYRVFMTPLIDKSLDLSIADGVIFVDESNAYAVLDSLERRPSVPAVTAAFGEHLRMPYPISIIECDLWKGTEALIRYLRSRGHHRIAMVSPYGIGMNNTRGIAWRACMESELAERVPDYYFEVLEHSPLAMDAGVASAFDGFFENGVYGAELFIESGCDATAVICFNEEMGLGFCSELRRRGKRIPEDLSVVSYDGTFMRNHHELPLTVLDLHPAWMGRECFRVLKQAMAGERVRHVTIQPVDILEGATVRPLS